MGVEASRDVRPGRVDEIGPGNREGDIVKTLDRDEAAALVSLH